MLIKNILSWFIDKNCDGMFSSVIFDEKDDGIKNNKNIMLTILSAWLMCKIANKNFISNFKMN